MAILSLQRDVPGIAFIIGGHSHTVLNDCKNINGTIITQAGAYGMYLGSLHMKIDRDTGSVISYNGKNELIPVIDNIAPDKNVEKMVAGYYNRIKADMEQVLGVTKEEIPKTTLPGEVIRLLGNLVTDMLRKMTKTEIFSIMQED